MEILLWLLPIGIVGVVSVVIIATRSTRFGLLDRFRPQYRQSSWYRRKESLRGIATDLDLVARIAKTDSHPDVRSEATWIIVSCWEHEARGDGYGIVPPRDGYQSVLVGIAVSDAAASVRAQAAKGVADQDVLARLASGDSDAEVRSFAAMRLEDQEILARLALTDPSSDVRRAATQRVEEQSLLGRIATSDADIWVRWHAVFSLNDQTVLARIAVSEIDASVRLAAVNKLDRHSNRALLERISRDDPSDHIREAAEMPPDEREREQQLLADIESTSSQTRLRELALNNKSARVRLAAVDRLSDQEALGRIATNDTDPIVRLHAVWSLKDQLSLARIAAADRDPLVRRDAVRNLTDQDALTKILRSSGDGEVRRFAVMNLTDQDTLREISLSGDVNLLPYAIERLDDVPLLIELATSADLDTSKFALDRLRPMQDRIAGYPVAMALVKEAEQSEHRSRVALYKENMLRIMEHERFNYMRGQPWTINDFESALDWQSDGLTATISWLPQVLNDAASELVAEGKLQPIGDGYLRS